MEKLNFTRAFLSDVRVTMVIMRVPVVELLCQAAMGQIPTLKCLLSGVCGCLWPHLVVSNIECHHFLRSRLQWYLPGTESPRA
jgi:hypothetical protein